MLKSFNFLVVVVVDIDRSLVSLLQLHPQHRDAAGNDHSSWKKWRAICIWENLCKRKNEQKTTSFCLSTSPIYFAAYLVQKKMFQTPRSFCGTLGRTVTSDSRGPAFKSNHGHFLQHIDLLRTLEGEAKRSGPFNGHMSFLWLQPNLIEPFRLSCYLNERKCSLTHQL